MLERNRIIYFISLVALAASFWVFWTRMPVLYPYSHFDYRESYRNFEIYSDHKPDRSLKETLDKVQRRMKFVDGYDHRKNYTLFICNRRSCYKPFARLMGVNALSRGLTIEPLGYVLINMQDIENTRGIYRGSFPYTIIEAEPDHIIAHELVHVITTSRLGFWTSSQLPRWKREGYAEYGTTRMLRETNPEYSLRDRARRYFDGYYLGMAKGREIYIQAGLVMEYLLDERKMGFDKVMNKDLEFDDILQEMKQWVEK